MSDKFPKPVSAPSVPQAFDGEIYKAVGKYARSAVLFAFEQMDGANGLADWAKENKDEFYTKLFPKIIARESEVTHHRTVDQLMDVIDGDFSVEGDFDEIAENDIDLPANWGQGQVIPTVAANWNANDYDLDDERILAAAVLDDDDAPPAHDPLDLVEVDE